MAENYDAIVKNHYTRPIFRLDTYKEYEEFNDKYVLVGKLNEGEKRNYPSFEEVTAHCDEEFFENNSLIVVFVKKGDARIKGYEFGENYLLVKMGKSEGTGEGIFCVVSVPDTDIEFYTGFKTENGY